MGITAKITLFFASLALLAASGCSKDNDKPTERPVLVEPTEPDNPTARPAKIHWIEDDYNKALAQAVKTKTPLVIDMWAPWCHTCLSMQHFVLIDPGISEMASRFTWLSLDTDKEVNAAALAKFPVSAWPTFFVVSADDEAVQARYLGSATVTQFREFLIQGERGDLEAAAKAGKLEPNSALWHVREGDRATVSGDPTAAATAYKSALKAAPKGWPRRWDVLVSQISSYVKAKDIASCYALATEALPTMSAADSASTTDFSYFADQCADHESKDKGTELRKQAISSINAVLESKSAALAVDDRSDALRMLRELSSETGDEAAAKTYAEKQRKVLDDAANSAPSPHAAMTYNWPRAEVYVYLDKTAELLPALEKSMADLPEEYDPPYRAAWIRLKMGSYDQALEAAHKALKLVYGPRKGRVQGLIAQIHKARHDIKAESAALHAVITIYESLPEGQKQPASLARAKTSLLEFKSTSR